MDDWEKIISFESLYKAHRRARLGKRGKKEVIEFEMNLSQNLWALHYDLKYNRYKPGAYHSFIIHDPKKREIQAIGYRDRIIQYSLCDNYLMPLLEKRLIYDNAACRKHKGTSFAIKRLRSFMRAFYAKSGMNGYFVKMDVSKYFNSIDHTILKEKLKCIVSDERIFSLADTIIDSYEFSENKGLPMGNQSSQCFALFYLDCIDRFIKENLKIKYYIRYMDDFLVILNSKKDAIECLTKVRDRLRELDLAINPKSRVFSVKEGVEFIGWRFSYGAGGKIVQTLRKSSKKRILHKARTSRYINLNKHGSLESYRGFLSIGNNYHFFYKLKNIFK